MSWESQLNPFIDPKQCEMTFAQLSLLGFVYGYALFQASEYISEGSDLLSFIPRLQGVIGSVVLPVLGAVPDGLMVFFSGIGTREEMKQEITVGVGTLAGSTIMLLTLPWTVALWYGRVSVRSDGTINYKRPQDWNPQVRWSKLMPGANTMETGVRPRESSVKISAILMMATMISYFAIQVPALMYDNSSLSEEEQAARENTYALVAFILSILGFCLYLYFQYREAQEADEESPTMILEVQQTIKMIQNGSYSMMELINQLHSDFKADKTPAKEEQKEDALLKSGLSQQSVTRAKMLLRHFFHKYDTNNDKEISRDEFAYVCKDIGLSMEEHDALFKDVDVDASGAISFQEFTSCILDFARRRMEELTQPGVDRGKSIQDMHNVLLRNRMLSDYKPPTTDERREEPGTGEADDGLSSDEESEPEEVPEDLKHEDIKIQQAQVLLRSCKLMGLGTILLLIFSDPMVDIFAEMGDRLNISPYYVAFILAPVASNASELVAAYNYAIKRNERGITVALTTLQGAACMNNTFCLSIFLGLVYFRSIPWTFTAEVISLIVVEVIMAGLSYFKRIHTIADAAIVCSLYPLSLAGVAIARAAGAD